MSENNGSGDKPIGKSDLIRLRRDSKDEETRRVLRWATNRIDELELKLREVHVLAKVLTRTSEFD